MERAGCSGIDHSTRGWIDHFTRGWMRIASTPTWKGLMFDPGQTEQHIVFLSLSVWGAKGGRGREGRGKPKLNTTED